MAQDDENYFDKLKIMREKVDWKIEYDRQEFLRQLYPIVRRWKGRLPNLRDIFRTEEIECLLTDSVNLIYNKDDSYIRQGGLIAKFVARSGYRDEPRVDKDGKTSPRRTTPIHHAARSCFSHCEGMAGALFAIYNSDVAINYIDERTGVTHFHAACQFGRVGVARKFLELGQDPNGLVPKTGDSPLHLALWCRRKRVAELLLRRGADPNLPNRYGHTALHVICIIAKDRDRLAELLFEICDEVGQRVLVDARSSNQGRTPLHLALARDYRDLVELLLRRGADPCLADDAEGLTPLHVVATTFWTDKLAELFFAVNSELGQQQRVLIDAKDKKGRTPLQLAVASRNPYAVRCLLDRGADLSSFVFPTESYVVGGCPRYRAETCGHFKLRRASAALIIVRLLEQAGYELDRGGALTIARHFARYRVLATMAADLDEHWYDDDDEEFAGQAKRITIASGLSLYDLVQLSPEEAEKRVEYEDYLEFARSGQLFHYTRTVRSHEACVARLCELITRRFFRRWALDPFWELIHKRLPLEICEMVLDQLGVKDLCSICLAAAAGQSS